MLGPIQNGFHFADNIFTFICFYIKDVLYFDSDFIEIYSQWFIEQNASIGLDNGLVPNRRQAIIWTNDCLVYWRIYASLEFSGLGPKTASMVSPWMTFR